MQTTPFHVRVAMLISALCMMILIIDYHAKESQAFFHTQGKQKPPGLPQEGMRQFDKSITSTITNFLSKGKMPPVLKQYVDYLDKQADGQWKEIPHALQSILGSSYGNANLSAVRYAEGINTLHGHNMTVGNKIYFKKSINSKSYKDMRLLLHELGHVEQYSDAGGVVPFLTKYLSEGAIKIARNGSFNVHDEISLEQATEKKAQDALNEVWNTWKATP